MSVIVMYVSTALTLLVLDALMLTFVMRPLFARHIGDMLAEQVRMGPAVLFYLGYVAGLVWLVGIPALRDGAPVILPAAVIGAMAYGTYEFTNYAVLKGWHPSMVAVDLTWGTVLTAFSIWVGVTVSRAIAG